MPIGWAIVVVAQWLAIIALAIVTLGVLRQVTPFLERGAVPAPPRVKQQGPTIGSPLPAFAARESSGEIVSAAVLRRNPHVLLFLSSDCSPCLRLAREIRTSGLEAGLASSLIVVTDPGGNDVLELPAWLRVLTISRGEDSDALEVRARPFAIAVDADGVVKGKRMLNTVAQLSDLASAVLSPALSPAISPETLAGEEAADVGPELSVRIVD